MLDDLLELVSKFLPQGVPSSGEDPRKRLVKQSLGVVQRAIQHVFHDLRHQSMLDEFDAGFTVKELGKLADTSLNLIVKDLA